MLRVASLLRIYLMLYWTIISIFSFNKVSAQHFEPEKHRNWNNLDHRHCGYSYKSRIVGGKDAKLGEFPWLVLIGHEDSDGVLFSCGGALLNRYYILTAEHCVHCEDCDPPVEPPNLIRAGEHNLRSHKDCSLNGECAPQPQEEKIDKIFRIEGQGEWPHNDIAIIRVVRPFQFNGFVMPVCLPNKYVMNTKFTGHFATVAGWGAINDYTKRIYHLLQKVKVRILEQETCGRNYKEFNNVNQICAAAKTKSGACNGDSGGPLFVKISIAGRVQYYAIGLVSYGPKVCTSGPTVYTNVIKNMNWILDHINKK